MNSNRSRPTPKASATRVRLDSTKSGSSPTCPPRFRLAKSPTLDPPRVDVKPQSTPRPAAAGTCSRQLNTQVTLAETGPRFGAPCQSVKVQAPFEPLMRAGTRKLAQPLARLVEARSNE